VGKQYLANPSRRELAPRVANDTHTHDGHIELLVVHLRHAPDGALRNPTLANDAVDACDDLRAVRQRYGARVELLEVSKA
jgi:hypothetical protein